MSILRSVARRRLSLLASASTGALALLAISGAETAAADCPNLSNFPAYYDTPGSVSLVIDDTRYEVAFMPPVQIYAGGDVSVDVSCSLAGYSSIGIYVQSSGQIDITTSVDGDIGSLFVPGGLWSAMNLTTGSGITVHADGDMGTAAMPVGRGVYASNFFTSMQNGGDVDIVVNGDIYAADDFGSATGIEAWNGAAFGSTSVSFGVDRAAHMETQGPAILVVHGGDWATDDAEVSIGDGSSIVSAQPIAAFNSGSGEMRLVIGDGVSFSNVANGSTASSNGRASITVGDDFALSSNATSPWPGQSGLIAISNAEEDGEAPSAEIVLGANASLTFDNETSYDSIGLSATATEGTASARIATGEGLQLSIAADNVIGISAATVGGGIDIDLTSGQIDLPGGAGFSDPPTNQQSVGILAQSETGGIAIDSGVDITVFSSVGWSANGIYAATGGDGGIAIHSTGDVDVGEWGIFADTEDGDISVISDGAVDAGLMGIYADASGDGHVGITNTGQVTASVTGILARSGGGGFSLVNTGAIDADFALSGVTSGGLGQINSTGAIVAVGVGVAGSATGEGTLDIEVSGTITSGGAGILAFGDAGGVSIDSDATIEATVGISAITNDGNLEIEVGGLIDAGNGIEGSSIGTGDVSIATSAAVTGDGAGIVALTTTGDILVDAGGAVTGTDGIRATVSYGGHAQINGSGDITGSSIGIDVAAVTLGSIGVSTQGAVQGGDYGIRARAQIATEVNATGAVSGNVAILAFATTVAVSATGGVTGVTTGVSADGYESASVTVGNASGGENAVLATSTLGSVTVTANGTVTAATGSAVRMSAGDAATLNVGADGVLSSELPVLDADVFGALAINNAGTIRTTAGGLADSLFDVEAGSVALGNTGLLIGAFDFSGAGSAAMTNGGTWRTSGESDFTAGDDDLGSSGRLATRAATVIDFDEGDDAFSNAGTLIVGDAAGASTLTLAGLEGFANAGVILFGSTNGTASDGETNDRLSAAGADFTGGAGSTLVMDVNLGAESQTSCETAVVADCLSLVGGSTAGSTLIRVNDTGGEGAINAAGIVLVDVEGGTSAAEHFALDPASDFYRNGVLAKGIFLYRLDYDEDHQQHRLVGEPDRAAFELTPLAASAQSIWYAGAQTWIDHQADAPKGGHRSGGWVRAIASGGERDLVQRLGSGATQFLIDVSHEQNTVGLQGGVDLVHDVGGGVATVGVMFGTLDSDVRFDGSSARQSFEGETYGAYAGWSGDGLFVNALVMLNNLDLEHRAGWASDQGVGEVTSTGVQIEGGWRLELGGLAVEPLAGLAYIRTSVDDLQLPGAELRTDDATSLRSSLGARVSGDADLGTALMRFSATGRFWEEFEGDNRAVLMAGNDEIALGDDFGGSFGELGAGFSLSSAGGGASFFGNVGVKFGDEYQSTDGTVGIRAQW